MARIRKILMAGAVLALVGAAACSDRDILGPVNEPQFDVQEMAEEWSAQREAAQDDAAEPYVPNRKYER